ncbi:hypothetical protein [Streptomyces sp. 3214.6]|uniref:hypothetical protein n=1 Tax=Streptomyces sp. 3214.6 TaxID=1882757 RepID=UPI00090AF7B6|nr:hypothetical protein [Streptomyces sp. 3214.6]SHI26120.1 hypothetical protein SAMN05444521_6405 [Streptomyces sp. 3214.6]
MSRQRIRVVQWATGSVGRTLLCPIIDADAVQHTPLLSVPYDEQSAVVERLPASGKNVISTNGFYRPQTHGESYAAPLPASAAAGGATVAGAGLNSGFVAERLALLLTGPAAREAR